ncbi:MAG TPA: hypothetical protein VGW10_17610, partial [Solirubrobacteraceae bacterium]|nr:hypothetical protein [Solirubrobacteraceae bacterium]
VLLVAAGLGLAAAPAVAVVTDGFDFGGGDVPRAGEPGGPPAPVTGVPEERTIHVLEYAQTEKGRAELRRRLAPYGIGLEVETRPVAPAAVGRVFGVQFPRRARFQRHRLVLEQGVGGAVRITVGRAARPGEDASTRGLTLFEVLPDVARAVDRKDPAGTGRRLAALGYEVRWKLIVDNPARDDDPAAGPTGWKDVPAPPPGTEILSVLNAGGGNSATPQTRKLLIEVAPLGSEILESHP